MFDRLLNKMTGAIGRFRPINISFALILLFNFDK